MRNFCLLFSCFALSFFSFCGHVLADAQAMTRVFRQQPEMSAFEICHAGGCAKVSQAGLNSQEWQRIAAACDHPIETPAAERDCIAFSIGEFEALVGPRTGTDTDRGGTFGNSAYPGQMDCNDEAINTTTYLRLMEMHGLLRYHAIEDIRTRGFFFNRWPHTTAIIRELESGQRYAVDAWFYDNGYPAVVLPFETWKSGWKPADSHAR
jgi:hypothetical protein